MAYYSDLSPYTYFPDTAPASVVVLNVGWLEPEHAYTQGEVPQDFVEALGHLCLHHPSIRARGWHNCRLAPPVSGGARCVTRSNETLPSGKLALPPPLKVEIEGMSVSLGSAEVRVVTREGNWLAAPNLVYHYVTHHGYRPPREFIEAVLARRIAPTFY